MLPSLIAEASLLNVRSGTHTYDTQYSDMCMHRYIMIRWHSILQSTRVFVSRISVTCFLYILGPPGPPGPPGQRGADGIPGQSGKSEIFLTNNHLVCSCNRAYQRDIRLMQVISPWAFLLFY